MKEKKTFKKLTFKKEVIAKLNDAEMQLFKAGQKSMDDWMCNTGDGCIGVLRTFNGDFGSCFSMCKWCP